MELLTVPELAERLRISKRACYRLADENKVPHYRAGRLIRFDYGAVLEALRRGHNRERKS